MSQHYATDLSRDQSEVTPATAQESSLLSYQQDTSHELQIQPQLYLTLLVPKNNHCLDSIRLYQIDSPICHPVPVTSYNVRLQNHLIRKEDFSLCILTTGAQKQHLFSRQIFNSSSPVSRPSVEEGHCVFVQHSHSRLSFHNWMQICDRLFIIPVTASARGKYSISSLDTQKQRSR